MSDWRREQQVTGESVDVIVIGAGPSGAHAAREMARLGYQVLILEEHARVGLPVHCTGVVGSDAWRQLGLNPDLVQAELSGARFFSPRGQSFFISAPETRAVVVDRGELDRWLCRRAVESGAALVTGARARAVRVSEDRAVVEADLEGEPVSLRASLVIVAAGANSSLARKAAPAAAAGGFLYAAQMDAQRTGLEEVEVYMGGTAAPGGYAWAVPVEDRCRVGLISRALPGGFLKKLVSRLEARGAIVPDDARVVRHRIPAGPRTPSFSERMLLVGDAAGQVKTTTGGGILFGLLGAQAAAETADWALRAGDFSAAGLARYEQMWTAKLGTEQRVGQLLRKVQAVLTDEDLELLFTLIRRAGIATLLSRLHFDWHSFGLLRLLAQTLPGL